MRGYGRRDPQSWQHNSFYQQKTSQTSGGRSVSIVRSRTKDTELLLLLLVVVVVVVVVVVKYVVAISVIGLDDDPRGYSAARRIR
jgi:hypothetical protein